MFDHSAGRSKEGRILIVDDEESIRKTIGLILKKCIGKQGPVYPILIFLVIYVFEFRGLL